MMCLSTKQVSKISLLIVTTYTTHAIYLYSVDIVTVKKKKQLPTVDPFACTSMKTVS